MLLTIMLGLIAVLVVGFIMWWVSTPNPEKIEKLMAQEDVEE